MKRNEKESDRGGSVRSWLMATSDVVMQGMGAARDFATVKDACPAGLRPDKQEHAHPAAAIPVLFLLFWLREIKLVGTCANVQTMHGLRKAQAFTLV